MANLHKPGNSDPSGYDADRNLQVMSINKRTTFYLVAGAGLDVFTDDEDTAVASTGASDSAGAHKDRTLSGWEKNQVIRVITLVAKSAGTTLLRATLDGNDWIAPLTVRVIGDATCRQVGKAKAQVTPELRGEIQGMSLRDAVIRVAEDQMHSAVAQTSGFGIYNMEAALDWCGRVRPLVLGSGLRHQGRGESVRRIEHGTVVAAARDSLGNARYDTRSTAALRGRQPNGWQGQARVS